MILWRAKKAQSAEEDRARRQRLDYQPSKKPIPVTAPVPVSRTAPKTRPAPAPAAEPAPAPVPDVDLLDCQDLRESVAALAGKYSLESFTIATSDGLILASSGGTTAQEDAALFNQKNGSESPEGLVLFSLNHKGSDLTGIIRSGGIIAGDLQERIESDTKDILNRWI